MIHAGYPVRVDGRLEPHLSRGLWLVKWLLALPHYLVLSLLWVAFSLVSVIAFFAILFTGRYPRELFDFSAGVLRWTWRVWFYSYGALGTDRYPPFSLGDEPDYPARLEIPYPERLSRGLVLVKWWLLALPHYVLVAVFVGGGAWVAWDDGPWRFVAGGGLVGVLVLIAAVVLLFTARYPRSIFDFVLGLDRWVLRVAAYVCLLTDAYPPFRLDMGGSDPASPAPHAAVPGAPAGRTGATEEAGASTPTAPAAARWTFGRILLVVLGSLAALIGAGLLATGTVGVVVDQTQRDADGFLMSPSEGFSSAGFAVVSETADVEVAGAEWAADWFVGTIRIRSEARTPVFVGIARAGDVRAYLGGVRRSIVTDLTPRRPHYDERSGAAPAGPPSAQGFWAASTSGSGTQALDWELEDGRWNVVVMNADGSAGVVADLAIGAELDALLWIAIGLLVAGVLALAVGALLIVLGVRRASG